MPIAINGSGSITGISAGGLPDACVTPADLSQPLTLGTAVASTSGTSIDFTGIPSWVKRITVMFSGVSTNGTSGQLIQLGDSGGVETSGYAGSEALISGSAAFSNLYSSGFSLVGGNTNILFNGAIQFVNITGNTWAAFGVMGLSSGAGSTTIGGTKTLSATLDRVRCTTPNGTDAFDAGTINILYEG